MKTKTKAILYHVAFFIGYVAIMIPEYYGVKSGVISPFEAACFEVGYILFGSILSVWFSYKE